MSEADKAGFLATPNFATNQAAMVLLWLPEEEGGASTSFALTPEQARAIAAQLVEAADVAEWRLGRSSTSAQ